MSDQPSQNPAMQALQLLISGVGYNFYNKDNTMRADDLLVRSQASGSLGDASAALKAVEADYARQYVPPSTRDQPYPPPEIMARKREIASLRARVSDLETRIRSMSVPTQDKIWWRFRQETQLLSDLLTFDHGLLLHTSEIARLARAITADAWQNSDPAAPIDAALQELESTVRARQQLLSLP